MIWLAFLSGAFCASIIFSVALGLCAATAERDEQEARSYPELEVSASEGFTLTDCAVNGAPLPPSWASGDDAA
jgi:hypothetical protein